MRQLHWLVWYLVVSVLIIPKIALGDSSPFSTTMNTYGVEQLYTAKPLARALQINATVFGVGRISISFKERVAKTWSADFTTGTKRRVDRESPVLLRGTGRIGNRHSVQPIAGAVIRNELRVYFHQRRGKFQRSFVIRGKITNLKTIKAHVARVPESALRRLACGAEAASGEGGSSMSSNFALNAGSGAGQYRVMTISTEADQEWYAKYGEQSNAEIAALVNAADVIYRNQLGLAFRLIKQHVYTGPSVLAATNSMSLLGQFAGNSENPINLAYNPSTIDQDVDLKHLFTGKDMDGSVIGIAYTGVLCALPDIAYGVTQDFNPAATFGIFAHEVGHNLGASHDTSDRSGLMYPSISVPSSDHFSTFSLSQIQGHISQYGELCLSTELLPEIPGPIATPVGTVDPLPPPLPTAISTPGIIVDGINPVEARLTLRVRRTTRGGARVIHFYGRLLHIADDTPYVRRRIELSSLGLVYDTMRTDSTGRYDFFLEARLPDGYEMSLNAQAAGGAVASNAVTIRRWYSQNIRKGSVRRVGG